MLDLVELQRGVSVGPGFAIRGLLLFLGLFSRPSNLDVRRWAGLGQTRVCRFESPREVRYLWVWVSLVDLSLRNGF